MSERQFKHEDVATVPRGWKVRTVTQASGHQARIAFPPGPRKRGAGRLISILHPQGENPAKCKVGSRQLAAGSNPRRKDEHEREIRVTGKFWTEGQAYRHGYRWKREHPGEPSFAVIDGIGMSQRQAAAFTRGAEAAERKNPRRKEKTREQVEKMQAKAVKFLRDVVKDDDKADEIEALSLDDYAAKKKITLGNPEQNPFVPFERTGPGDWHIFHKPRGGKPYPVAGPFATKAEAQKFHRGAYKGRGSLLRYVPAEGYSLNPRGKAKLEKRKAKSASKGRRNPKRRRRNQAQDAKALYQKFHGKPPKEVLELQESAAMRGEYASLGDLVELIVKSPAGDSLRIGFEGEKVKLASSPNGGQLYFLGGNQALDGTLARFKTDATKDLVDLGEAQSIVYRAAKDFTGFKSSDWEHEFGEESGERPSAFYDKLKQRIFLVGGTYRVERPGIVD